MAEIAKCPICGKVPHDSSKIHGEFYIECCGIDTDPRRNEDRSIEAWNRLVALYIEVRSSIVKEASNGN